MAERKPHRVLHCKLVLPKHGCPYLVEPELEDVVTHTFHLLTHVAVDGGEVHLCYGFIEVELDVVLLKPLLLFSFCFTGDVQKWTAFLTIAFME